PQGEIVSGEAMAIATGGMIPRGADAVMMIEHAEAKDDQLAVRRAVAPAFGITFAGTDIAAGETILRSGTVLTSRETGVLAAIGKTDVPVFQRPKVAIISTGDEIIVPGEPMQPALVYDSNAQILADAIRELGGSPLNLGIVKDDIDELREKLKLALQVADVVLLSGGTSKGQGDLCYRVVAELKNNPWQGPGIVAHGVALKPGKPICLASEAGKPVVILPGFPTSAVFTFHEFVAPVISLLGGRSPADEGTLEATMAVKVNSEIGRTEYLLVGLVDSDEAVKAYPMGKGSGSVTTFSQADGFVTIDRHTEIVDAGSSASVQLIGARTQPADLVVIGSHCVGLDFLLSKLSRSGLNVKFFAVGSTAGLEAARRGECDIAGIHLLDEKTDTYNHPFLDETLALLPGYGRSQGIVFRQEDRRFAEKSLAGVLSETIPSEGVRMINRNRGSGTRILIDQLLAPQPPAGAGGYGRENEQTSTSPERKLVGSKLQPQGHSVQAKSHNAVVAAVAQSRADWGVAIRSVAESAGLVFLPLRDEQFDFVIPKSRLDRPAVVAFKELLESPEIRNQLTTKGFNLAADERG
ncbi:MAG: molybdopterin biosynthesis protein, partial [Lacipirellulaceae bacterium]